MAKSPIKVRFKKPANKTPIKVKFKEKKTIFVKFKEKEPIKIKFKKVKNRIKDNLRPKRRIKPKRNPKGNMFGGGNNPSLTVQKAKLILKEGIARGKKLTAKQKRFFGAIAGGQRPKRRKT